MSKRFTSKTVLISGAASGQGACEARMLTAQGAQVIIGDIDEQRGRELAREIGDSARFVRLDVTSESDWQDAIEVAERIGPLSALVNNAGIFVSSALLDTDTELFERHYRVNQLGCFLGMKSVVPALERSNGGAIVNVASIAALRATPGAIAYSASKWAVRGMSLAAAHELAGRQIRVNCVFPGPIATPMIAFRTPEENRRRAQRVPLGRIGTPEEVARLVLFLISDESSYMTGAEISVDGGLAA